MNKQKELGTEKILPLLLKFSIPAIIGMLVQTLYNIIDRMYIGNIPEVGNLAITGVGVTLPISTIIMAFGMLVGVGTAARISLKLGEGKKEEAEKHLANAMTLLLIIAILITAFGLLFLNQILGAFGASDATILYARQYSEIIFIGTIFNLIGFGLNHSIRSDGSPKIAMYSMLIGAIINIVLDPIFIFGFGLGVRGAAIATVISQVVSAVWILRYFLGGKSNLKFKPKYLKLDRLIVISIFSIGVSPFSMQIAGSIVQVLANNTLKAHGGDLAIGAMAIVQSVGMIFLMPIFGINQGAQPIIGYNYGAKQYKRVKECVKYAAIAATIIVTIGFLVIQIYPQILIQIFNQDPELVGLAKSGLRLYLFMLPVVGFQVICANYFQAIGKASIAMFLSLLRQVLLLIPCILILPQLFGTNGVWLSGAISDAISALITTVFFIRSIRVLSKKDEDQLNLKNIV
ncbi:MAG: MATE family efflux transporter [Clostridium sp.]